MDIGLATAYSEMLSIGQASGQQVNGRRTWVGIYYCWMEELVTLVPRGYGKNDVHTVFLLTFARWHCSHHWIQWPIFRSTPDQYYSVWLGGALYGDLHVLDQAILQIRCDDESTMRKCISDLSIDVLLGLSMNIYSNGLWYILRSV